MQISNLKLKRLLKLSGPLLFIFLFMRVVDPKSTASVLREIRPEIALASVLLFPVTNAAVTVRWWLICQRLEIEISFRKLFQIYYISWFLSVIPFVGIAPFAKLLYLKEEGKTTGKSAVSITLDKLFDVIGLMAFGIFGLVYFPQSLFDHAHLGIIIAGGLLGICILWIFGSNIWSALMELLKRYTNKRLQKLGTKLEADLKGFWSSFNIQFFFLILGISIAIGILRALVLYILAISLNIYLSFGLIVACRAIIGIVNVIPVTISGLGTRDAILLLTLPIYGVSKEAAIALGFIAFLWTICSKFSGTFFWLKHPLPSNSLLGIKKKLIS
jgi:uncharacterized protein (TIRG00374 family)